MRQQILVIAMLMAFLILPAAFADETANNSTGDNETTLWESPDIESAVSGRLEPRAVRPMRPDGLIGRPGNCTSCMDRIACGQVNTNNQTCNCTGANTDGTYQFCGYGRGQIMGRELRGPELDQNDEKEVKAMNYPNGARVRLLELEKQVSRNLLIGSKIVEVLESTGSEADLAKLDSILDELEALLEDIKEKVKASEEEVNKTELAKDYVDMKKLSINLTQQFREESRPFINQTVRDEIAATRKLVDDAALRNISEEIKQAKCEYNAKRLEEMLGELKGNNPDLIRKLRECSATGQDITAGIGQAFRNMAKEEKQNLKDKARENAIKANVMQRERVLQIRQNITLRQMEQQRMVLERIQNRSLERNQTRLFENVNDRIARITEIDDRMGMNRTLRPIGEVVMPGGGRR